MQSSLASLNWQFRDVTTDGDWHPAIVPGCVHTDLRREGMIPDPFWGTNELDLQWIGERTWEYRAEFEVAEDMRRQEVVELVADGLDTVATVLLNGAEIARTENMFVGYRWNITERLREGSNELRIVFSPAMEYIGTHSTDHTPREINDPVGGCTRIRKEQCQFGWDWGPRFVTAGIWQDLRLEGWSRNRLVDVRVTQHHAAGAVRLELTPETAHPAPDITYNWELKLAGETVQQGEGLELDVPNPQLWWPQGHGDQPLYTLRIAAFAADESIGSWERRIGLRTVVLDQSPDAHGEAFQFVVNGRPIFAKGANWIPAHSFVAGLSREDYARDLRAAADVHMNMIRVWGGGIYESEHFYDLCDELGLLVWQDFMFSCTLYPGDATFLDLVREEAAYQIRRLRHRASLALWCGNNELPLINREAIEAEPKNREAYDELFYKVLPEAVTAHDPITAYWPSSPYRHGANERDHAPGERRGDTHFWDVWHVRHPVSDYQKWRFRFVSEFGMQAFCTPQTQATFCPPEDANVFGATMENHQKNRMGNQIILDYVSRRYRFPKSQDDLLYLSQLNQAYCLETGVEFYRRISPHCMGALYWQLNDCWPVASWSSIEFTGQWRALHFAARRFFAPTLVTAQLLGEENVTIGNYRQTSFHGVELYTVSDLPEPTEARLFWDLIHLDGRTLLSGAQTVTLEYGRGQLQCTIDLADALETHGREQVILRIGLAAEGQERQEETVFFARPRFLNLPQAPVHVEATPTGSDTVELRLRSDCFQHRVCLELPGHTFQPSDNYFELYPGEEKSVSLRLTDAIEPADLLKVLRTRSLADTY